MTKAFTRWLWKAGEIVLMIGAGTIVLAVFVGLVILDHMRICI